ncbi:hypothetical protein BV22DRAFT_184879 [Leucogyrophana mollusca]|uniref:Uncharacterized protein n=1 Tax=Leucogyrophana mollusca TaxID=85980 RepID=A0ACB8BV04_9AGAM|nr:hypothetical protein BV22DRAFT_184879 [Leucogyrophana mollusca]
MSGDHRSDKYRACCCHTQHREIILDLLYDLMAIFGRFAFGVYFPTKWDLSDRGQISLAQQASGEKRDTYLFCTCFAWGRGSAMAGVMMPTSALVSLAKLYHLRQPRERRARCCRVAVARNSISG